METFHDPQDTFNDTHQIDNELLETIQQEQYILYLDNTTVPDANNIHVIITDTHSFTVTIYSKIPNDPTRQIAHNTKHNDTNQYKMIQPKTLSQQVTRSFDPPPIPPQFSTHSTFHNSPQHYSSSMHMVQHVPQIQSQQTTLRTPPYTSAQTSNVQSSIFAIDTIHTSHKHIHILLEHSLDLHYLLFQTILSTITSTFYQVLTQIMFNNLLTHQHLSYKLLLFKQIHYLLLK